SLPGARRRSRELFTVAFSLKWASSLVAVPLAAILTLTALPPVSHAEAQDWDIPGGHRFTQAGGYDVIDNDGVPFWREFRRLGGVQAVGYPVTGRFQWDGFTVQVMQRAIFQWRPEAGQVYFVNVFDRFTESGKDDWLTAVRQTPKPVPASFDDGKNWNQIVLARLSLLDANPAIRSKYFSVVGDAVMMNGLPTSQVTDMGNNYTLRAQRVVFQQWKENVPWAKAGEVTVALGGAIAKEAGLLPGGSGAPAAAAAPDPAAPPAQAAAAPVAPAPAPAPVSAPVPSVPSLAANPLDRINAYRAAAGVPPAQIQPALQKAVDNHIAYLEANRGDASLSGMGLHQEKPGALGFTGVSMGDRAKAAGYRSGAVTENAGSGNMPAAVDWYMNTVNHRLPLIHPSAVDIAIGATSDARLGIIDVGLTRDAAPASLPSVYPPNGATGVGTSWDGGEAPDPAPGLPRPLGYPLTVAFGVSQRVEWRSLELHASSGEALPVTTPRTDWMRAAAIIPLKPLAPGQTYTAHVEAVVDGKTVTKDWSFTTR
ncbi:MAG: CAP domain-containing protein, partial [Chloroflexi bacterium]|nr:CAP domain-containing protein [Chloroflexota bacterium]